jgi:hypothetical protein
VANGSNKSTIIFCMDLSIQMKIWQSRFLILFSTVSFFIYPVPQWLPLIIGISIYFFFFRVELWFFFVCSQVVVIGTLFLSTFHYHKGPVNVFAILITLASFYSLLFFITNVNKRLGVLTFLSVGALSIWVFYNPTFERINGLVGIFIYLWATNLFAILMDSRSSSNWNTRLALWYNPPWTYFSFLPLGGKVLKLKRSSNITQLLAEQRRGLQLVLFCGFLSLAQTLFYNWVIKNGGQIDQTAMISGGANNNLWHWIIERYAPEMSRQGSFLLATFLGGVMSMIKILFQFGFAVAVARMFGFSLIMFPYRFLEMTTLSRFYGNLLYYYNRILVLTFYSYFFSKLRSLGESVRARGSLFFTLFIGGVFAHFVFNLRRLDLYPSIEYLLIKTIHYSSYSLIIAIVATSAMITTKTRGDKIWYKILKIIAFFSVYSVLISANVILFRKDQTLSDFFSYLIILIFGGTD